MVYDAPAGPIAAMVDSVKKVFRLGCDLCTLTHGIAGKRKEWEECENKSGVPISYLHKDEIADIEERLGQPLTLPCVLVEVADGDLEILLSKITIENLEKKTPDALIEAMQLWAEAIDVDFKCKDFS